MWLCNKREEFLLLCWFLSFCQCQWMNYATIIQWSRRKVSNKQETVVDRLEFFFWRKSDYHFICEMAWMEGLAGRQVGRHCNVSVTITRTSRDRRAWQTITSRLSNSGKNWATRLQLHRNKVSEKGAWPCWVGWGGVEELKLAPSMGDSLSNYGGCTRRQEQSPPPHFSADIFCNCKLNSDVPANQGILFIWP